jgi:hypothetical protein
MPNNNDRTKFNKTKFKKFDASFKTAFLKWLKHHNELKTDIEQFINDISTFDDIFIKTSSIYNDNITLYELIYSIHYHTTYNNKNSLISLSEDIEHINFFELYLNETTNIILRRLYYYIYQFINYIKKEYNKLLIKEYNEISLLSINEENDNETINNIIVSCVM